MSTNSAPKSPENPASTADLPGIASGTAEALKGVASGTAEALKGVASDTAEALKTTAQAEALHIFDAADSARARVRGPAVKAAEEGERSLVRIHQQRIMLIEESQEDAAIQLAKHEVYLSHATDAIESLGAKFDKLPEAIADQLGLILGPIQDGLERVTDNAVRTSEIVSKIQEREAVHCELARVSKARRNAVLAIVLTIVAAIAGGLGKTIVDRAMAEKPAQVMHLPGPNG